MLFYLLLFSPLTLPAALLAGLLIYRRDPEAMIILAAPVGMISIFLFLIPAVTWSTHAENLAKAHAQDAVIEVQSARLEALGAQFESFRFPEKPGISLDADAPWATITTSLANAQDELARAERERAVAIRSIEATRHGPMSGVVSWVGDYRGGQ